jgi:2-C-methyl-D-erythritol 4-phosphate cytidylyltransferase
MEVSNFFYYIATEMTNKLYAIIVAGGSGARMKRDMPKQFIPLGNKPIIMLTVSRFLQFSEDVNIVLVLPEKEIQTWENLCNSHSFDQKKIQVVAGGASRFLSVKNGLKAIDDQFGYVAIHDGVRPIISRDMIEHGYKVAKEKGNAITSVVLKESIRIMTSENTSSALDRNEFRLVQTPQTFQLDIIKKAYNQADSDQFTDDASVAESAGEKITLIEGSYQNIKITTPEDLLLAEAVLKNFQY